MIKTEDMIAQKEGNKNEPYYLCENIWLNKKCKTLYDEKAKKLLNINCIEDKITIFERETTEWLFFPMAYLLKNDIDNKSIYAPFKNSIYLLFGIFSYIEKTQRYKDGKPYISGATDSTKILTYGFKQIFKCEDDTLYGNGKIEKILEETRHCMMHTGNIGDNVLLNSDYDNGVSVRYIGSNKKLEKIELNPRKMFQEIYADYKQYVLEIKNVEKKETRENFEKVFDLVYKDEIKILGEGIQ